MVGQFKDDRLQRLQAEFGAMLLNLSAYMSYSGVSVISQDGGYPLDGGTYGNYMRLYRFDTNTIARSGATTRGKSKGVKYIIKVL